MFGNYIVFPVDFFLFTLLTLWHLWPPVVRVPLLLA